ncbi:cytochrome C [Prochlorococcus marinus XMU1403]|uniref:c-type cytochrome n=1 Tax=Prochlorococcus marinus TaxID=1219 RepID=UPI000D814804|nr:c-type cytochrome [Prochlorococcus marinus]MBW3049034.1 cytochrome C [Prochlorococcus marinus str. MU1403]PYE02441.1 cytochrome C [Prochlorococcus marinus XMU1403]
MKKNTNSFFIKLRVFFLISICCTFFYLSLPKELNAIEADSGGNLFNHNCAGCHVNGGNIIRRSKNLKISSLKRNGIDNPEAIAKIARQGVGIMSGYEDELGDHGDQIVANWVWEQAQKAWVQE